MLMRGEYLEGKCGVCEREEILKVMCVESGEDIVEGHFVRISFSFCFFCCHAE